MAKYLLLIYLWEGVIAKTSLAWYPGVWQVHMVLSLVLPFAFLVVAFSKPRSMAMFRHFKKDADWYRIWLIGLSLGTLGIVSSLFQPEIFLNLVYSIGFLGMVTYCWLAAPIAMAKEKVSWFLDLAFLPMYVCVFVSLIYRNVDPFTGRFDGVFYTTAQASIVCALCVVMCYYRLITSKGLHRFFFFGCLVVCISIIVWTKTRAALGVIVIAVLAMSMSWKSQLSSFTGQRKLLTAGLLLFLGIVTLLLLYIPGTSRTEMLAYLRIEDSAQGNLGTRTSSWMHGYESMSHDYLVGSGWLSRWGAGTSASNVNYTFEDDPHNMLLAVGQSLGIGGLLLSFALLCFLIYRYLVTMRTGPRQTCPYDILYAGIAIYVVFTAAVGNVLISFGGTRDRYLWVLLSLLWLQKSFISSKRSP